MTIEELKQESFFQQLSEGQQKFVIARCSGKAPKEAAKESWVCTTDASATAQANKALKNANVRWLIGRFLGIGAACRIPSRDALVAKMWERVEKGNCDDQDLHKLVMACADLLGYRTKPAEPKLESLHDGEDTFEV